MTAAELYKIVKDVPREAWPRGVDFGPCSDGKVGFSISGGGTIGLLESAFVGSMTAWLAGRSIEVKRQSHENSELRYTVTVCNGWEDVVSVHVELVAALAAACKEAAR